MWLSQLFVWFTFMGLVATRSEGISVSHLRDIETYPDPTKPTIAAERPDIMPLVCFFCDPFVDGKCSEKPTKRTECYPSDGKPNSCITVHMRAGNITIRDCEFELVGHAEDYCLENIFCSVCSTNYCNSMPVHSNSASLMGSATIISAICVISSLANV